MRAPDGPPHVLRLADAEGDGAERLLLQTEAGDIEARHHPAQSGDAAVLWLPGAGGGLDGPAGGLHPRLGARVARLGIASLALDWRRPGALDACLVDALFALAWLLAAGRRRVVVVGHSFGGAVAIAAGVAASRIVVGVAALSSQTRGTDAVEQIAPRPLLVVHGLADEILPPACSRDIHRRAGSPKRLILYPACGHGLDECRAALDRDLKAWTTGVLNEAGPRA